MLNRASGITDPMYTQTTRQVAALITKGSYGGSVEPITSPEYTMTPQHNFGVAGIPMLIDEHNKKTAKVALCQSMYRPSFQEVIITDL